MKRIFSFLLLAICLAGCRGSTPNGKGKPLVVTSIPPYISVVKAIVGDAINVETALSENFDPHTTEATPTEMRKVQDADLFIGVGEAYERKLVNAMNMGSKRVPLLELNQSVSLVPYSSDTHVVDACQDVSVHNSAAQDLHIWLGPQVLIQQIPAIINAVSHLLPDQAETFAQNGKAYMDKIKALNKELIEELRPYQHKAIVVSHPALGYFCREFYITQIAVECEGKEPLPRDATNVLRLAKNSDVICVFTAPQFNNKGAELIAQKLNLRIEAFDPLGEDPLQTMRQVANALMK